MQSAEVVAIDGRSRTRFVYRPDGEIDTWCSHADDVLAGRDWAGDCDDLASTVLDLLGREGLPLVQRFRLLVKSNPRGEGAYDHMIACAIDDAGGFTIVGDTFGDAYPAADCPHQAFTYQRLDEVNAAGDPVWRDGYPWQPT